MTSTQLRHLSIEGPWIAANRPLWRIGTQVRAGMEGAHQDGGDPLVDRNFALRAMDLQQDAHEVGWSEDSGRKRAMIRPPGLLRAELDAGSAEIPLEHPSDDSSHSGSTKTTRSGDPQTLLLAPTRRGWPDVSASNGGNQITMPRMRLVAGGIPLKIPLRVWDDPAEGWRHTPFGILVHYWPPGSSRLVDVFNGARGRFDEHALEVMLTPEGVEFDLEPPHPLHDVAGLKGQDPRLAARVRLEPDPTRRQGLQLRFLREPGEKQEFLTGFADHLRALGAGGGPLRANLDRRPGVSPFVWKLFWGGSRQERSLRLTEGSRVLWRIVFDPLRFDLHLETNLNAEGRLPAVARLRNREGESAVFALTRFSEDGKASKTVLGAEVGGEADSGAASGSEALTIAYPARKDEAQPQGGGPHLGIVDLAARLALAEAAARRRGDGPKSVFLPTVNGILQLPVAPPSGGEKASGATQELVDRTAFTGGMIFRLGGVMVEIDGAKRISLEQTWRRGAAGDLSIRLDAPSGALREFLWTAEESPEPARLLPTGRRHEAQTRELIATFGVPASASDSRITQAADGSGALQIEIDACKEGCGGSRVFWTPFHSLPGRPAPPAISAMPMLRLGGDPAEPDDLRDLIPLDAAGRITLSATSDSTPPAVRLESIRLLDLWPSPSTTPEWGLAATPFASPTAPGLEIMPGPPRRFALRHDLPILDELFARPDAPADPEDDPGTGDPGARGVMDLEALGRFWKGQAVELALTRTRHARASDWAESGARVAGPQHLVSPFATAASIVFMEAPEAGTDLATGGYRIAWEQGPEEVFFGDKALKGVTGRFGLRNGELRRQENGSIAISGGAAASHRIHGLSADALGTAMASPAMDDGDLIRRTARVASGGGLEEEIDLLTLAKPRVLSVGEVGLRFWLRDLPLGRDGLFSGEDAQEVTPQPLAQALHEWRLWREPAEEEGGHGFTVGAFHFTPLRLQSYRRDGLMRLLCRAELAGLRQVEVGTPFDDDLTPEEGALVSLSFDARGDCTRIAAFPDQGAEGALRFRFPAALIVGLAGAQDADPEAARTPVELEFRRITPQARFSGARLKLTLLGAEVAQDLSGEADALRHSDDAPPRPGTIRLKSLELSFAKGRARIEAWLAGSLALNDRASAPAALSFGPDSAAWLGVSGLTSGLPGLDHARGVMNFSLSFRAQDDLTPVSGLSFTAPEGALVAQFALEPRQEDGGVWSIRDGTILAEIRQGGAEGARRLRMRSSIRKGKASHRLSLDLPPLERVSGIRWTPDGVRTTDDREKPGHSLRVETQKADAFLDHRMRITLVNQPIAPEALAMRDGSVVLAAPLELLARVDHRLGFLAWSSIEPTLFVTPALWRGGETPETEEQAIHVHGSRYRITNARYRDPETSGGFVPVAGIGSRLAMLSGFDDPVLLKTLDAGDQTPMLIGGGVHLVLRGSAAVVLPLPWVAGLVTEHPPSPFDALMAFGECRTWRAAWIDARAPRILAALPPGSPLPTALSDGEDLAWALRQPGPEAGDWEPAILRSVEQAFFEPSPAGPGPSAQEWPFFLPTLLALQALNLKAEGEAAIRTLHLRRSRDRLAAQVLDIGGERAQEPPVPVLRAVLRVHDGEEARDLPLDVETTGAVPVADLERLLERMTRPRLRAMIQAAAVRPRMAALALLREREGSGDLLAFLPLELLPEPADFGRILEEGLLSARGPSPSRARGWPRAPALDRRRPLTSGEDQAVVSDEAGLAARSVALGAAPMLLAPDAARLALVTRADTLFAAASAAFRLDPRLRLPTSAAREASLKAAGVAPGSAGAILPPHVIRSVLGKRPGVIATFVDAVASASPPPRAGGFPDQLDEGQIRFGAPAGLESPVARQLRTPRSPAYPRSEDPLKGRRSFVSEADGDRRLLACDAAATIWRGRSTEGEAHRFLLALETRAINLRALSRSGLTLSLLLDHAGEKSQRMRMLAATGFLRSVLDDPPAADLEIWLSFGAARIPATRIKWKLDGSNGGALRIAFDEQAAARIEELPDDPDLHGRLVLRMLRRQSGDGAFDRTGEASLPPVGSPFGQGVPALLSLPLGLIPRGRRSLPIRRRSFIFADPAYDRLLIQNGAFSDAHHAGRQFRLACDRGKCAPDDDLVFAVGPLDEAAGLFAAAEAGGSFRLEIRAFRGSDPAAFHVLSVKGEAFATPHGLALGNLGAPLQAGDSLELRVAIPAEGGSASPVEIGPLSIEIVAETVAPATASVVTILEAPAPEDPRLAVLLHQTAPVPTRLEHEEDAQLLEGLARGVIRRSGLFVWSRNDLGAPPDQKAAYALVMTDRSGGAQLINGRGDLAPVLALSGGGEARLDRKSGETPSGAQDDPEADQDDGGG
ncbi:hypothetical protein [Neomegalonema sp.]|uniref:hypothetical protein n=1 Tax=Neomegalonema sp. TaxID=2039713 RepID=UPI0026350312|nr:hypothetical protein [Neomegalonema sp.]MDD2869768.1 hypothetical protein [Neomegalonema sp.]